MIGLHIAAAAAAGLIAWAVDSVGEWFGVPAKILGALTGAVGVVTFYAGGTWIVWVYARRQGVDHVRLFRRAPRADALGETIRLALMMSAFATGLTWIQLALLKWVDPTWARLLMGTLVQPGSLGLPDALGPPWGLLGFAGFGVVGLIVAPLAEEYLWRGLLLQRWAVKWSPGRALVATAALFGLAHMTAAPSLFCAALLLGVVFMKTGSLRYPIILHATHNAVVLVIAGLAAAVDWETQDIFHALDVLAVAGLALCLATGPRLYRWLRRWWPAEDAVIPYRREGMAE